MKKHWDDFFFFFLLLFFIISLTLSLSPSRGWKNHIFISKARKRRHIKTDTYWKWLWWHQGLFWGNAREKKAASGEMRKGVSEWVSEWERKKKKIDSDERRSYLNLEGEEKMRKEFSALACLFIFLLSLSLSLSLSSVMLNIYTHQVKRIRLSVFYHMWYQTIYSFLLRRSQGTKYLQEFRKWFMSEWVREWVRERQEMPKKSRCEIQQITSEKGFVR
jgi:hypothetical protein